MRVVSGILWKKLELKAEIDGLHRLVGRSSTANSFSQCLSLHLCFSAEILQITKDRGDGFHPSPLLKAKQTVLVINTALDFNFIPRLCVPDIVDRSVIVLTPKERNVGKCHFLAKHISGRSLSLALSYNPVLYSDVLAGIGVWPSSNVARRENAFDAGFQVLIDDDTSIEFETCVLGKRRAGVEHRCRQRQDLHRLSCHHYPVG